MNVKTVLSHTHMYIGLSIIYLYVLFPSLALTNALRL